MARKVQDISPSDRQQSLIILYRQGTSGNYVDLNFTDGSINYVGRIISQDFRHVLIDNIGAGTIRVAYNGIKSDISSSTDGAKTLPTLNSLYIEDKVWAIRIYFVSNSSVEIVLISDKEE